MKKFYLILLGVATLSFATLSCTKEAADPSQQEQSQKEENPKEDTTPENPTGEDDTPVPEGMVRLTFGVSHEGDAPATEPETADSKTSWDGSTHAWSDNDEIRILWGTGDSDFQDVEVVNNKVTLNIEKAVLDKIEYFYAVYPAALSSDFVLNDGKIDFCVRRYQDGTFASANKMVARAAKTSASLAFKNVTHIVKFSLTNNNPYDQFEFTSNESSQLLVDVARVTFDENNNINLGTSPTSYTVFGNSHSKYVDLQSGITAGKDYYFAVLPGCNLDTGFGVKARKKGETSYSLGALSKRKVNTDRLVVTNIGNLDPMIHADWFIKEDGTGKGSSWEDAGNLSLFLKLIKDKTNDQGINSTWRLYNAKIHFAEGTYDIYAANGGTLSFNGSAWDMEAEEKYQLKNLNLTIDGGYPSSNTGTSLDHKDPVNHPTKWQTAQTDNTYRVFEAAGCRMSGWTFDGITFEATGPHILPGDVFHFDSTTSGTVNFSNCYFKDFVTSEQVNGGPVYIHGGVTAEINFIGCTFSGNRCNTGGVAYIHSTNSIVNFKDCKFTGNKANDSGGSIRARAGKISVSNCTFTGLGIGDGDENTAKMGGALYVDGAIVNISGGSISKCKTANSGAIGLSNGSLSADGLLVSNCRTTSQGAGLTVAAEKTATLENCKFTGLTAGTYGGAISNSGTVTLTNCTLSSNDCATNGGAIYNSGNLEVLASSLSECEAQQGGAIYSAGNTNLVGKNVFNNNRAIGESLTDTYGGAVWFKGEASQTLFVDGATFINNKAPRGAAVAATGGSSGKLKTVLIFNCTFENNTATGKKTDSQTTQQGGIVFATGYGTAIIANSTAKGNTTEAPSSVFVTNGSYIPLYVVSCTAADNGGRDLTRTATNYYVYNSILMGPSNTENANVKKYNSIINKTLYGNTANAVKESGIEFALGEYKGGVFLLDDSKVALYTNGMTADALKELTFTNIPTDKQKELQELLAKDQKGNDRGDSKIMGAYVKTTDPTE